MKFRYIPNVSRLNISLSGVDAFALCFGIVKQNRDLEFFKFRRLSRVNNYLERQYARLYRLAFQGKYQEFEKVAYLLIKSSKAYQLAMLHSAQNNWMLMTTKKIYKIWDQISRLSREGSTDLKYERWWIDKKEGSGDAGRPLGAPKLPWKVITLKYLQVWEIFYRATGQVQAWQHAGISKRGLITAWSAVLSNVLNSKYIYEFDLKGFFDRINNQNSIPELPNMNKWLNELVNKGPSKYHLPPLEKDTWSRDIDPEKIVKAYNEGKAKAGPKGGRRDYTTESSKPSVKYYKGISYPFLQAKFDHWVQSMVKWKMINPVEKQVMRNGLPSLKYPKKTPLWLKFTLTESWLSFWRKKWWPETPEQSGDRLPTSS